jgi:hypothetical protein
MMPALAFDRVMEFNWGELKAWHSAALEVYKNFRGIDV